MKYYDCGVEEITKNHIALRLWSKQNINLHLRDFKLFFEKDKKDEAYVNKYTFALNNSFQIIKIIPFKKDHTTHRTVSFIVADVTNRTQHAVSVSLDTKKIDFKDMIFGE